MDIIDLPVYDIKTRKVVTTGLGGKVLTARNINVGSYNRNLIAAKRRIFDALKREGIEIDGLKHKKRVSMFLTMFDFQRPVEIRLWDYIIELYKQGLLPDPTPEKRKPKASNENIETKAITKISDRRKKYLDYLNSKEWREFRIKALVHFGNQCGLCTSTQNLQLHHKTYKNLFNETFEDVIPLCKKCHKRHHDK